MTDDYSAQLEAINNAILANKTDAIITVWIPILVVIIGAVLVHIFSLYALKRKRENLKFTVVLWIKESIDPIDKYIEALAIFIDNLRDNKNITPIALKISLFDLECLKSYSIDQLTDALVARLKIEKDEKGEVSKVFYNYYNTVDYLSKIQMHVKERYTDYRSDRMLLLERWNNSLATFLQIMRENMVSRDIIEEERPYYIKGNRILDDFAESLQQSEGDESIAKTQIFIEKILAIAPNTFRSKKSVPANMAFNELFRIFNSLKNNNEIAEMFEGLLRDMKYQRDILVNAVTFYERYRMKGIFCRSNKIT